MKSRTSFFNTTVLKKDLTRFAPLWGVYGVLTLLFVLVMADGRNGGANFANDAAGILGGMAIVNLIYAGLCAVCLFGDLFRTRMCYTLHTFSLRREGWFFTHLTAGMLMCLVPNLLGALVAGLFLQSYFYMALLWLAVMLLQFITFFGIAVFCVMCAGNQLGMGAMYALVNFVSVLLAWVVQTFYQPVVYGMDVDVEWMQLFSPVVSMAGDEYVITEMDNVSKITLFKGFYPQEWGYLFVVAALGIGLLALSLVLYRKRDLETAGDFIALRPVGHVFLVVYTLFWGAILNELMEVVAAAVGLTVGFFTGKMLLERKVNVFGKKNLLTFVLALVVFGGSLLLTWLDPIGVTRYIPTTDEIESVEFDYYEFYDGHAIKVTDPAAVEEILLVHAQCLDDRGGGALPWTVHYNLKNGKTLERRYNMESASRGAEILQKYYSSPDVVLADIAKPETLREVYQITVTPYNETMPVMTFVPYGADVEDEELLDKYGLAQDAKILRTDGLLANHELVQGLIEAIKADCAEGNMAQYYTYHLRDDFSQSDVAEISFRYTRYRENGSSYNANVYIVIYEECHHTLAYLKAIAES